MSHPTSNLIELRHHYQNIVAQSEYQVSQAKMQLAHIDALLVNGLLQAQELPTIEAAIALPETAFPALAVSSQAEVADNRTTPEFAEDVEAILAKAKSLNSRNAKTSSAPETKTLQPEFAQGNRVPRPLLLAYQGLKRLEAIAKVLQIVPGQEMTIDSLILALFGDLSTAERNAERKRLKTLLYQGEKQKLWQKGTNPSSYLIRSPQAAAKTQTTVTAKAPAQSNAKAPAAKAKVATAPRGRDSISLLPAYEGMNKLEAIAQVLMEQSGHVLHQDTIFQLLYGEVSPEVLSEESRRMRASLFQGVSKGLWEKASNQPSSYLAKSSNGRQPKSAIAAPSPAKPGRKSNASAKAESGGDSSAPTKTASRGRTQVLSLPAQYAGLSKIETVAKVLEENKGKTMHMDEIIEHLYGKLSGEDLKAEKVRMKDVMTRGVQRQLWRKAQGVPSSIVAGESDPRRDVTEKASVSAHVTKLNPATPKKPRKASSAKTTAKPKGKKAEVVALLRKSNIKV
jgi:hypothetical protein